MKKEGLESERSVIDRESLLAELKKELEEQSSFSIRQNKARFMNINHSVMSP